MSKEEWRSIYGTEWVTFANVEDLTEGREEAIRDYAQQQDFDTLRGFHHYLRRNILTYYDILKIVSPYEG